MSTVEARADSNGENDDTDSVDKSRVRWKTMWAAIKNGGTRVPCTACKLLLLWVPNFMPNADSDVRDDMLDAYAEWCDGKGCEDCQDNEGCIDRDNDPAIDSTTLHELLREKGSCR